jgi:high-affinity iron transporter
MLTPFLIMVREGFEAALIVAIVFAYLRRIGRLDLTRYAWLGVGAAVVLATVVGVAVDVLIGSLGEDSRAELRAYTAISLVAACVLTWMIFWMRRQSRAIKGELEHRVDAAVATGDARRAIIAVAFFSVLREGIEGALFLVSNITTTGGRSIVVGGVLGLAVACVLGWLVYTGGRRLPMSAFFRITGMIVVVFAAGLVAKAVLFVQTSGDLGSVWDNVFDLRRFTWLTQQSELGKTLAALIGWDPRPSIEQVVAWVGYFVPVTWLFLRSPASGQPAAPAAVGPASDPAEPARV